MEQLSNKVNRGSGANYQLPAEEWNQVPKEIENIISTFGITLSDGDLNQLGKAIAGYVGTGDFFTDGGVANSVVLSAIGTQQAPTVYTNGMRVRFRAAATNTGATVINVNGIGSKKIRNQTDTALAAGDLVAGTQYELTYYSSYDAAAGAFVLDVPSAITNTFPQGFIYGCILSNNVTDATNDIDISAGTLKDSTNALDMTVASAVGKRIDAAWTAGGTPGATVGGFPTGIVLTNNTWYRMFIIAKADGTTDAGFDTSSGAANLLADAVGYSYYQQVGWVRRGVGANLLFFQNGDDFTWDVPSVDANAAAGSAAGVGVTLLCPPSTLARFTANCYSESTLQYIIFTETRQTNTAPVAAQFDLAANHSDYAQSAEFVRRLDSSSQIRERSTGANTGYYIFTKGWSGRY